MNCHLIAKCAKGVPELKQTLMVMINFLAANKKKGYYSFFPQGLGDTKE